jgi:type II secretory pathway component PulC
LNEKLRKGLVFGALAMALIWAYFTFADRGDKVDRSSGQPEATETKAAEQGFRTVVDAITDSMYNSYKTKPWGKNPFYHNYRPPVDPVRRSKVEFHLMGVMFGATRAQALIDNRIVTVGDKLKGFRITEITRDSVVLDNGETTLTLRVQKETS